MQLTSHIAGLTWDSSDSIIRDEHTGEAIKRENDSELVAVFFSQKAGEKMEISLK